MSDLTERWNKLTPEQQNDQYPQYAVRFQGVRSGFDDIATSQRPGKKEGRGGMTAVLSPEINKSIRDGKTGINTQLASMKSEHTQRASLFKAEQEKAKKAASLAAKEQEKKQASEAKKANAERQVKRKISNLKAVLEGAQTALGIDSGTLASPIAYAVVDGERVLRPSAGLLKSMKSVGTKAGGPDPEEATRKRVRAAWKELRNLYSKIGHLYE